MDGVLDAASQGGCIFGCGMGEDKLQHFAYCKVVGEFFIIAFNLAWPRGTGALDAFLCMDTSSDQHFLASGGALTHEEVVVRRCLCLYALYRLYNGLRHHTFTHEDCFGAFHRFIREGMR